MYTYTPYRTMYTWKLVNWVKFFGKTGAIQNVNLTLEPNKVYGLVGPNGSGKSTLIKALTGVIALNSGKLFKDSKEVHLASPIDAYKHDICAAYQELALISDLSVRDNLILFSRLRSQMKKKKLDRTLEDYVELLFYFRERFPLNEKISDLNRGDQQIVEIVKAFGFHPLLLLLDEPTSFLAEQDIQKLFELIKRFKQASTIVFVSHRLREVFEICDEIIIMKDGVNIGKFTTRETNINEIVSLMAGARGITEAQPRSHEVAGEQKPIFFQATVNAPRVRNVSIVVARGEVVGLAGLVGHGQSEFLRIVSGLLYGNKKITLENTNLSIKHPADAARAGIIYVSGTPSDVVLPHRTVRENVALIANACRKFYTLANIRRESAVATHMVHKLNIVCRSINEPVQFLSGGNQQKTVIARALTVKPKVLLLDDPLKGIDTVTKAEFYGLILEVAKDGCVIFFSSDVDELLLVASRILVMYEGRVVAEFAGQAATRENILAAALRGGECH